MSKYELSDAAVKRITKHIESAMMENMPGSGQARELVRAAVTGEDFADPTKIARLLICRWIMDGEHKWLCRDYFESVDNERVDMRKTVRNGFRVLEDLREKTGDLWVAPDSPGSMICRAVTTESN